jgi:EmrB/QacA subfamily drug resistance transporter
VATWGVSLSIILGSLTNSIMMGSVNVAVPTMMTSLRADVLQIQWVLTSFMIARTVVMPTLAWAGGRLGNRRLYLISLSVYVATSMLCGLAWNLESLIAFRVLQGMGAGYLFPLGMTILHETYPPGKRGTAMGVFMFGVSFGPAIGPSLGGYLVEHLSWRAVFYINFPIGLVALIAAAIMLPDGEPRQRRRLDLPGLVTMMAFVVSLLLAVSQTRQYGWGAAYILILLGLASASLVAFVAVEWRATHPLLNLQIFANVPFVLGAVVAFCESFTGFAMNFVVSLFLQQGLGLSARHAGELLLPGAIIWGLTSLLTGKLTDKVDGCWLILLGALAQSLSLYLFTGIDTRSSTVVLTGLLMLRSLTRGFIQSPVLTVTMATLPDQQVRLGTSVRGLLNSFGATFGIAVAGLCLQQRLEARTISPQARPQGVEAPAQLSGPPDAPFEPWLLQEAALLAYHDVFASTAAMVLVTAIPVLWLRRRRLSGSRKAG